MFAHQFCPLSLEFVCGVTGRFPKDFSMNKMQEQASGELSGIHERGMTTAGMLQIQQDRFITRFVNECGSNSSLPTSASTAYSVDIVFNVFRHINHFGFLLHIFNFLDNIKTCCPSSSYIDSHWLDQSTFGKVLNLLRHCSTEQQCLTLRFEVREDCSHIFFKPHVNHAISFIKNQISAHIKIDHFLI
ncbi:hypothetical protein pdam_00015950 [Pocillopora damicornis]|uniref:Uncharacterized protein n=1 Tax=Pocillopora damicornis TaxID=46731 RepID=A0A3M6TH76_POCDA|nr:hypothetical protein pdam_00015950 [Pocillopora damicornis]